MNYSNYSIFFSYTIRDGLISKELLKSFKENLNNIGLFNTYIDLLDNNNQENPQIRVFEALKSSSIVFIINTPHINNSPWVAKEINLAKNLFIPTFFINFDDFLSFSKCSNINLLYSNPLTQYIINLTLKTKLFF